MAQQRNIHYQLHSSNRCLSVSTISPRAQSQWLSDVDIEKTPIYHYNGTGRAFVTNYTHPIAVSLVLQYLAAHKRNDFINKWRQNNTDPKQYKSYNRIGRDIQSQTPPIPSLLQALYKISSPPITIVSSAIAFWRKKTQRTTRPGSAIQLLPTPIPFLFHQFYNTSSSSITLIFLQSLQSTIRTHQPFDLVALSTTNDTHPIAPSSALHYLVVLYHNDLFLHSWDP